MAIKELRKSVNVTSAAEEHDVEKFIAQGGSLAGAVTTETDTDHRLTLRIPRHLMDKIDAKRKERIGKISRNLWILEVIQNATTT